MTKRILMILTAHNRLGESGGSTGFWAEEFTAPYARFTQAGYAVELASPGGLRPPVDPASLTDTGLDAVLQALLDTPADLASVDAERFDGVFLVGGHGTMWDFPDDKDLAKLVSRIARAGVVGAVCHGVAGLLLAADNDGPLVAGRHLTCFSDAEEAAVGAASVVPFLLQSRLEQLGAIVAVAEPFTSHVVSDGRLVTGQNPQSSTAVADLMVEALVGRG